jgi:hypothetical protein
MSEWRKASTGVILINKLMRVKNNKKKIATSDNHRIDLKLDHKLDFKKVNHCLSRAWTPSLREVNSK